MDHQNAFLSKSDTVWYLAYGSNLSRAKFTGGRGIEPLAWACVRVPGWQLALNVPGLPYSEPTFTSIIPISPALSPVTDIEIQQKHTQNCSETLNFEHVPEVLGIAYLVTNSQYVKIIASEGGGIAYKDIELRAVPVDDQNAEVTGEEIQVRTLGNAIIREPWPRPSQRYMEIVIAGALESEMPAYWLKYLQNVLVYQPPNSGYRKAGATIFLAFWVPIMGLMEKITYFTIQRDGYAPKLVIWMVRIVMWLIWFSHDTFFAPVCGRGDGRDDEDIVRNVIAITD